MLPKGQLFIGLAAVVAIMSFFLPWWTAPNYESDASQGASGLQINIQEQGASNGSTATVSGWERATHEANPKGLILGKGTFQVVDVDRPQAPLLLGVLIAELGCLVVVFRVAIGHTTTVKGAKICIVSAGIGLILLLVTVLQDQQFPNVRGLSFPLFWNAQFGVFLTILANIVTIGYGFRALSAQQGEAQSVTVATDEWECTVCGALVDADAKVCPSCATEFED